MEAALREFVAAAYEMPSELPTPRVLGKSREGRKIRGWTLGTGATHVSLVGGCHADEPVGPMMLHRLVAGLEGLPGTHELLRDYRWWIVPHLNPDGAARNAGWTRTTIPTRDHLGAPDRAFDLATYLENVVREMPGDDVEFGFPVDDSDDLARPENRAVARFLSTGAPFHLHGTFHGMSFAPGPWFLIEAGWEQHSTALREDLRQRVGSMGYPLFDVDRHGEKGFRRIDRGFCTRPDSAAMRAHFENKGDFETAGKFRPSSMEFVRRLGADPFTLVSEMPLFLLPDPSGTRPGEPLFRTGTEGRLELHAWLERLVKTLPPPEARSEASRKGVHAMPIRDQMRLQVDFLAGALELVLDRRQET